MGHHDAHPADPELDFCYACLRISPVDPGFRTVDRGLVILASALTKKADSVYRLPSYLCYLCLANRYHS
jgi:hypothetical protein